MLVKSLLVMTVDGNIRIELRTVLDHDFHEIDSNASSAPVNGTDPLRSD
jgi:hypothetical protein